MKKLSIKLIELDRKNHMISIDRETMNVSEANISYTDSGLFSYFVLRTRKLAPILSMLDGTRKFCLFN